MRNRVYEEDTIHLLYCSHYLFSLYRNEVVSTLQLKVLDLLDENMLPLCFLEWILDDNEENIEEVPDYVMPLLNSIGRRNIWFGFLPTIFVQWVKWKFESMKQLGKFIVLCIEALYKLWLERHKIVHECMASRVKVEDHHNLLNQVKMLFSQVEISASSPLHQYKHKLNHISKETLRGVAYELLSGVNVSSYLTLFYNIFKRQNRGIQRDLRSDNIQRRDQATIRQYQQTEKRKQRREEFEDMVEMQLKHKRDKYQYSP